MSLPILGLVGLVSVVVVWKASVTLEDSADRLCRHYRIPALVQGSLVAAVASSLPELASSLFSTLLHGEFGLGVSIVVGSAIFNVLVIPGLTVWKRPVRASKEVVYRDAQFYVISIAVLLLAFSLAVIYRPVEGESLRGEMGRLLALLPLLLYGLYLFLQFQDTTEGSEVEGARGGDGDEIRSIGREWLRLVLSVVLVLASAEGLVRTAVGLGEHFSTPSFLWGVTVVAAATSAPDAVISMRAAGSGRGVVSMGNVFGSNIFDLLVAVPLGVVVGGSVIVDFATVAPLVGFLTVATIFLFASLRTEVRLTPGEGRLLLLLYLLFVGWMVAETVGLTTALGS